MSAPARKALLLVNPKARNGSVPLDEVRHVLRAGGIEPFEPPGEAGSVGA